MENIGQDRLKIKLYMIREYYSTFTREAIDNIIVFSESIQYPNYEVEEEEDAEAQKFEEMANEIKRHSEWLSYENMRKQAQEFELRMRQQAQEFELRHSRLEKLILDINAKLSHNN